jgi:hypothetical protein
VRIYKFNVEKMLENIEWLQEKGYVVESEEKG